MKKLIVLGIAVLLLAGLAAQKTAPSTQSQQAFGRQLMKAFTSGDYAKMEPLNLDDDGVTFIIDATMNSEELQDTPEDELGFTRGLLEATFAMGLSSWRAELQADFDSLRTYGTSIYDIEWDDVQYLNTEGEVTDNGSFRYIGPVQVNFRWAGDEYTIWVQEVTDIEGDWQISGFNMELTSRGAPVPEFNDSSVDDDSWGEEGGEDEEYTSDDSWDEATDDDSWETDPAADPRSKKAAAQDAEQTDDSWEEE